MHVPSLITKPAIALSEPTRGEPSMALHELCVDEAKFEQKTCGKLETQDCGLRTVTTSFRGFKVAPPQPYKLLLPIFCNPFLETARDLNEFVKKSPDLKFKGISLFCLSKCLENLQLQRRCSQRCFHHKRSFEGHKCELHLKLLVKKKISQNTSNIY